jgi:hypothetical protein
LEDHQLFDAVDLRDNARAPGAEPILGLGGFVVGAVGFFGAPELDAVAEVEGDDEAADAGAGVEVDDAVVDDR